MCARVGGERSNRQGVEIKTGGRQQCLFNLGEEASFFETQLLRRAVHRRYGGVGDDGQRAAFAYGGEDDLLNVSASLHAFLFGEIVCK